MLAGCSVCGRDGGLSGPRVVRGPGPGRAEPGRAGPGRAGPSRCRPGPRPAVFGPRIAYKLQIFLRKISNSTDENVAFLVVFC